MEPNAVNRRHFVISLALAAVADMAQAQVQQGGVPAEVADALAGAVALGTGRMRFFGLNIYDARLWVTPDFKAAQFAQYPLALELTYLRSLSGRAIADRSLQEMRRGATISAAQQTRWLAAMQSAFADVQAGDRITGVHTPSTGAQFWYNGQPRTPIDDPEFSRLFFGIWLAPTTSAPDLRIALLGRAGP